jgi:hypothetical protein
MHSTFIIRGLLALTIRPFMRNFVADMIFSKMTYTNFQFAQ